MLLPVRNGVQRMIESASMVTVVAVGSSSRKYEVCTEQHACRTKDEREHFPKYRRGLPEVAGTRHYSPPRLASLIHLNLDSTFDLDSAGRE